MATNRNINLAREFVYRLQNTCYNHTTIQVINALAQNTNATRQTYYGGILALRRQTHLSADPIKTSIRKLALDGVIRKEISRSAMYHQGLRQNYRLVLPPEGIHDCSFWEGHNKTEHHLSGYEDFARRLREINLAEEVLREIQARKNAIEQQNFAANEKKEDEEGEEDEDFNW